MLRKSHHCVCVSKKLSREKFEEKGVQRDGQKESWREREREREREGKSEVEVISAAGLSNRMPNHLSVCENIHTAASFLILQPKLSYSFS